MKLPLDFYNYTKLKGYVNFFSSCSIAPPNKLFLGCKPLSFALKKKQCHVRNGCHEAFCQKALLWKFWKIHRMQKHPCYSLAPILLLALRNSSTSVLLWVLRNFKKIFLTEHLRMTASCLYLEFCEEHLFYRTPLGVCLFHVQVGVFQSAYTITIFRYFLGIL